MGLLDRFFGRRPDSGPDGARLVANREIEDPLSLQVLFGGPLALDPERLTPSLRAYDPELRHAVWEVDAELASRGTPLGLVGWGDHVIQVVAFDVPMPAEAVEYCVAPAFYAADLKERARAHRSHALLYYAGRETSPVEQYAALAAVAGTMAQAGALVVANETARTSVPISLVAPGAEPRMMQHLRELPLLLFYAGFVKMELPEGQGVWMRTHGCPELGLPDLATLTPGHEYGETIFGMFSNILDYLRDSGAALEPGHTMQVGADEFLRLRAPEPEEYFLESEGTMLVIEPTTQAEINQP